MSSAARRTSGIVVSAIVRRDDDVLMVHERHPGRDPQWVLPGGMAEAGELVHDALVREVREETGLIVAGPAELAFVAQYTIGGEPGWNGEWTVFAFTTGPPTGVLGAADPDGIVLEAAWVPADEAVARLSAHRFRPRRDPIVAHLRGEAPPGTVWLWPSGPSRPAVRVPAQSALPGGVTE